MSIRLLAVSAFAIVLLGIFAEMSVFQHQYQFTVVYIVMLAGVVAVSFAVREPKEEDSEDLTELLVMKNEEHAFNVAEHAALKEMYFAGDFGLRKEILAGRRTLREEEREIRKLEIRIKSASPRQSAEPQSQQATSAELGAETPVANAVESGTESEHTRVRRKSWALLGTTAGGFILIAMSLLIHQTRTGAFGWDLTAAPFSLETIVTGTLGLWGIMLFFFGLAGCMALLMLGYQVPALPQAVEPEATEWKGEWLSRNRTTLAAIIGASTFDFIAYLHVADNIVIVGAPAWFHLFVLEGVPSAFALIVGMGLAKRSGPQVSAPVLETVDERPHATEWKYDAKKDGNAPSGLPVGFTPFFQFKRSRQLRDEYFAKNQSTKTGRFSTWAAKGASWKDALLYIAFTLTAWGITLGLKFA